MSCSIYGDGFGVEDSRSAKMIFNSTKRTFIGGFCGIIVIKEEKLCYLIGKWYLIKTMRFV